MDNDATWVDRKVADLTRATVCYMGTLLPRHLPKKGAQQLPQFSAYVCCAQTAKWIKIPLGMEVVFSPGHTALFLDPASPRKGAQQPRHFRPMSIVAKRSQQQSAAIAEGLRYELC